MYGRVGDNGLKEGEVGEGPWGGVAMRNFDVRRLKRVGGLGREASFEVL
jgi:hypothetical protein